MKIAAIPALILASISFYVGLYHLLIYSRQTEDKKNLSFALTCLAVGLYDVFAAGVYNADSVAEASPWQRGEVIAMMLFGTTIIWFISDYTGQRPKKLLYLFSGYFLVSALVQLVDRSELTWRSLDTPAIKEIVLPKGFEITYYEMAPGPYTDFQSLLSIPIFLFVAGMGVQYFRRGNRRDAIPLLLSLAFFWAGIFNDTFVSSGLYDSIYLIEYAFMALIFLMAGSLARQMAQVAEALQYRVRQLSLLNDITRIGTTTLKIEELARQIATHIAGVIEGDHCYISLWDEDTRKIIPYAASDELHEYYRQQNMSGASEHTLTASVVKEGRVLIIPDVFNTPYVSRDIAEKFPSKSVIALPLEADGRRLGALIIGFKEEHSFSPEDIAWCSQVAELMALALAKAQSFEYLEQRVQDRTTELAAANEELTRLGQIKDEFVSNVSHELRSPLSSLKLRGYLLERHPDEINKHLAVMQRETERLDRTIADLLNLSRLDQGQVSFEPRPTDINLLVRQMAEDRRVLVEGSGQNLRYIAEHDLPLVMADSGLITQVLSILLTNATHYTPAGGEILMSTAAAQFDGRRYAGFSVSDTGPGISSEEQGRIFERFFRGKAGRESGHKGTGLGLALSREIIDRHGGRIAVESKGIPGQGVAFHVWIPIAEGQAGGNGPAGG